MTVTSGSVVPFGGVCDHANDVAKPNSETAHRATENPDVFVLRILLVKTSTAFSLIILHRLTPVRMTATDPAHEVIALIRQVRGGKADRAGRPKGG